MDFEFANSKLRRLCENAKEAQRRLGPHSARKLRARLSDLVAANAVGDLVAGRPHPLKGERSHEFSVSLHGGDRLVFEAAGENPPLTMDGSIDWNNVSRVRITEIGDYHD
ncbi:MAG: killer suppression protein HigA [Cyanobacteria bacterium J06638_22]